MKKLRINVIFYAVLVLAVLVITHLSLLDSFDYLWLDRLLQLRSSLLKGTYEELSKKSPSPVIVIAIPSYQEMQKKYKDTELIKGAYTKSINILRSQKAAVIALNFIPPALDTKSLKPPDASSQGSLLFPAFFYRSGKTATIIGSPGQALEKVAGDLGLIEVSSNVKMRFIPLRENVEGKEYDHFVLETLAHYYRIKKEDIRFSSTILGSSVSLGTAKSLPLQGKNQFFINYFTSATMGFNARPSRTYSYFSMEQLLGGKVPPAEIEGKIVLLGSIDPMERYFTMTPLGIMSDCEIFAQALYSVVKGPVLFHIPVILYDIILLVLGGGCYFLFFHSPLRGMRRIFPAAAAAYLVLTVLVFMAFSTYLDIFPFLFLITGIFFISTYTSPEEKQAQTEAHLEAFRTIVKKSIEDSESPDWGNSLLTLICQPLSITRGVLMINREDRAGPEGREAFCYPPEETPSLYEGEINAMIKAKKPLFTTSSLVVPLMMGENVHYGVLKLQKKSFTSQELQMMMALSQLTFISLYTMRLMEKVRKSKRLELEAELASKIQKALLVEKAPPVKGADIACRCISASEVGGDYFDFVTTPDGSIGIACGDVTGHGMGAALIMGLLRSVLRSQASQIDAPCEVVTAINNVLYNDFVSFGKMSSLFYCTYRATDKTLAFTNAGHNPPLLIRATELNARPLKGKGPILGFRPNIKYKEFRIKIYPKDILIFMTDGIVEAENESKEFFGTERVEKIVAVHQDESAQEILDALFDEVEVFTQGLEQKDDMTLVVMKV
ncbi:MAG: SpoIIE family protein phosphatase [Candidatus Eremiobacteraeota bacterium]|nr:SpoIIE family protein phosphatase [Candidatus Eremiobacteraeota bacterium]